MPSFEVVNALIIRDNRIFLTQRRHDQDFPLTWECSGGHVDGNESHHQALARELKEELGVDVLAISELPEYTCRQPSISRPGDTCVILFYRVTLDQHWPIPQEGQGSGWFTPKELRGLTHCGGLAEALENIIDLMRRIEWTKTLPAYVRGGQGE